MDNYIIVLKLWDFDKSIIIIKKRRKEKKSLNLIVFQLKQIKDLEVKCSK